MYDILLIIALLFIVILVVGIHQKTTNAICMSRKRLDGKTALVTGGTSGIGLEVAKDLAHRGAKVIIACPYQDEGNSARKLIIEETENENVIFKMLDLSCLDSIRKFAAKILSSEDRLDILVNNAGVGVPCDSITSDGMHFIMQVNYYGTFLLTLLLLPLLKKTGKPNESSRIILTSSLLHQVGQINFQTMNQLNSWTLSRVYGNSKLCLVLFANELTKKLQNSNVVINCADPGLVATRIYSSFFGEIIGSFVKIMLKYLFKTPWEGAQTTLHLALDKEAGKESGKFYRNCHNIGAVKRAYCENTATKLWEDSLRLVKVSDEELIQCFN